jgi:tRNA A-37 threonylcarbamoyl transferase component Bud32/tetratricopeptide (TPR) repeat protein
MVKGLFMSDPQTGDRRSEKEIFAEAIEKATPQERAAYLDGACGRDSLLRRQVEDLLAKHFQQDSFMKEPAVEGSGTVVLPISEGPGTVIGRYKLLEKLGEGGFGAVYVAEQKEPVKRRVALKIIKLGMDTKQVIARFEAERQALALMDHPNIAKVFDAGATETGRPYFVMELVRGVPITKYCDENKLSTVERLGLFMAVCHAIQHAHLKGIIHRDIKPSNILVTLHDGVPVPKVIDFGIARATHGELTDKTIYTQFQQFIGTPAYVSPEQAELSGLDMDTRSDIYSLGVLLYELLVGRTPFDGRELLMSGLDEMRRVIREEEPLRPSTRLTAFTPEELTATAKRHGAEPPKLVHALRGDLDWIVMKCLEKDRARRYETASGISADLKRYLTDEPVVARPPSPAYQFHKFVRRHKGAVAAAGAVAVALIVGLGVATFAFLRERQARLRQVAAEKAKQAETIRADAVAEFMWKVLASTAPELLRQGQQRSVRDLLKAADELASTDLSNAPAAEIQLRDLMSWLYASDFISLLDVSAGYQQMKRIKELLPVVPEDKLGSRIFPSPYPRDEYRIRAAHVSLWAGQTESGWTELRALKDEFRRRTPPADASIARCLIAEGNWHLWKGEPAVAEEKLTEALRLIPSKSPPSWNFYVSRINLAMALSDRGAAVEAEKVARERLLPPGKVTPDLIGFQLGLASRLADALCQQKRFAEAESLLREQERELSGLEPRSRLMIQKQLGEVLARAGKPREALPILMSVAIDSLGNAQDCADAAFVAIGSGDLESYQQLCGIALSRYTAGAEGLNALSVAAMLLAAPQNEVVIRVAHELIARVEEAGDFSKDVETGIRAWLQFRKGNLPQAAALWQAASPPSTPTLFTRARKFEYAKAVVGLRSALPFAQLGRSDEARQAYAEGLKDLGPAPSEQKPRDLGESYARWYLAEAHRREAEQLFKVKGISIRLAE